MSIKKRSKTNRSQSRRVVPCIFAVNMKPVIAPCSSDHQNELFCIEHFPEMTSEIWVPYRPSNGPSFFISC
jgi:hypothetical protein